MKSFTFIILFTSLILNCFSQDDPGKFTVVASDIISPSTGEHCYFWTKRLDTSIVEVSFSFPYTGLSNSHFNGYTVRAFVFDKNTNSPLRIANPGPFFNGYYLESNFSKLSKINWNAYMDIDFFKSNANEYLVLFEFYGTIPSYSNNGTIYTMLSSSTFEGELCQIPFPNDSSSNFEFRGQVLDDEHQIEFYPNPIHRSSKITLELDKSYWSSIEIYNSLGRRLFFLPIKHSNSFETEINNILRSLSNGIYHFVFRSGSRKPETLRIIMAD